MGYDTNVKSANINNRINTNTLSICNAGNTPNFRNRDREDVIDFTLPNMDRSMIREDIRSMFLFAS